MSDVKETKELLVGIFALINFLNERLKDGFGVDDIAALYAKMASDQTFKKKVLEALKDAKDVPVEMKGLDFSEVLELSLVIGPEIISIVGSMKPEQLEKFNSLIEKIIPAITAAFKAKKTGA
ncbi:MAG: hypothetical protein PHY47_00190 [Lachnospiraceae bacterium]|nr:hypothetical protein [Lachnospiraceae bacterium]